MPTFPPVAGVSLSSASSLAAPDEEFSVADWDAPVGVHKRNFRRQRPSRLVVGEGKNRENKEKERYVL